MFGKTFASIGMHIGRSVIKQNVPCFNYSTAMSHIQVQSSYLKMLPNSNTIMMQNLRQMLLSKREVIDLQSVDLTTLNQAISLILRGTLTAKSMSHSNINQCQLELC